MKKAFAQLHIAILLAGFTGVFGKLISLNEGLLTWYRLFLSGSIFWLFLFVAGRLKKISFYDFLKIGGSGLLLALHWVFFYGSIKYSNISVGVVCFSLTGFFTALLGPVFSRKKISTTELFLSGITLLGIALIFQFDTLYRTGIIMGIISSIVVSVFTIANERLTNNFDTETITVYEMLGGWLGLSFLMPLYLHISPAASLWPSISDMFYLLILSVVCTIVMYSLITQSLRKISAFTVNLSFNLEPVYSIILAMLIFNENRHLTPAFYAGLSLILLSVILTTLKRQ